MASCRWRRILTGWSDHATYIHKIQTAYICNMYVCTQLLLRSLLYIAFKPLMGQSPQCGRSTIEEYERRASEKRAGREAGTLNDARLGGPLTIARPTVTHVLFCS